MPTRFLRARALVPLLLLVSGSSWLVLETLPTSRGSKDVSQTLKFERMFATKTKYWDQRTAKNENVLSNRPASAAKTDHVALRHELELIQTQIVARHGIR